MLGAVVTVSKDIIDHYRQTALWHGFHGAQKDCMFRAHKSSPYVNTDRAWVANAQVFDVELIQIKNCVRRKTAGGFFSDVVCE